MAGADRSCAYGANRWEADPRIARLRDRNEILVGARDAKVCNRKGGQESGRITMRIDGAPISAVRPRKASRRRRARSATPLEPAEPP